MIRGIAINETTTRNGVKYTGEELKKSAYSMRNRPILKDHNNSVESIVGRTTMNIEYDDAGHYLPFEGRIVDEWTKQRIKEGLITNVSVGAHVQDLAKEKTEEGDVIVAKGIEFVELSLVAVPGDPNAGIFQDFNTAVSESFKIKEREEERMQSTTSTNSTTFVGGGYIMPSTTGTSTVVSFPFIPQSAPTIQEKNNTEEDKMDEKVQEELKLKDAEIASLKEKLALSEAERKKKAIAEYDAACKEKNVTAEKTEAFTTEQVIALTKAVLSLPKVEESKPVVNNNTEAPKKDVLEGYDVSLADSGRGFALYKKK
jgi:HK97 family phage prohead protease